MKALTVRQPWASLIVYGPKWIETRTRSTNIRGRIGIVAGKYWRPRDLPLCVTDTLWMERLGNRGDGRIYRSADRVSGWTGDFGETICVAPFGALIGTVELYDCVPIVGYDTKPVDASTMISIDSDDRGPIVELWDGDDWHELDQYPYGDFTPGRWAWMLREPEPSTEPIPMRGALNWQEVIL